MKFECISDNLNQSIQQVIKACSKSASQSMLNDIHIQLEDHLLTLKATNLELFCEKSISVKGIQNGSCIIKGETLFKTVTLLTKLNTPIVCELIDGVFNISYNKNIIEIKTTPYEDFPTTPKQGEYVTILPVKTISNLFREVMFCCATTEIKPEIASIYLYTQNGNLFVVATDSYRLAEKNIPLNIENDFSLLIPQKHTSEILSILDLEEGDVSIYKKEGILSFETATLTLSINIITGQFPDYRQLFPKEYITTLILEKEETQKVLTLTTYFTEQYSSVLLKTNKAENEITFSSKNESVGSVTNTIKISQEGEDIEAQYNNKYFLDVFSRIQGNKIKLLFTTPNRPMIIKSLEDDSFTYLLMPLNK